jgi:hypothetical protein
MNDNEARGLTLRKIYNLRNTGRFVDSGQLHELGFDRITLDRYLTQLEQLNLITMKALRDNSGLVDAMIQITAYGINSIERPETAPPQIVIIQGDVQVGDRKTQEIRVGIGKVEAAMDGSAITKVEHPQKKSMIRRIMDIAKSWFVEG